MVTLTVLALVIFYPTICVLLLWRDRDDPRDYREIE